MAQAKEILKIPRRGRLVEKVHCNVLIKRYINFIQSLYDTSRGIQVPLNWQNGFLYLECFRTVNDRRFRKRNPFYLEVQLRFIMPDFSRKAWCK